MKANNYLLFSFLSSILSFALGIQFQRAIGTSKLLNYFGIWNARMASRCDHRMSPLSGLNIPNGAIVFMGDSLIDLHEWNEVFPGKTVINRGISGAHLLDLVDRFDLTLASSVFLLVGINDIQLHSDFKRFKSDYRTLVDSIPQSTILHTISIPSAKIFDPLKTKSEFLINCNQFIREITEKRNGIFIDIYSESKDKKFYITDGLHLSTYGYKVLEEKIATKINNLYY